eukprot:TRINITY_DN2831_c0_g2_i1.p1 TRINITY_DN2831_c0_g2~~TRINITY_DN2831_c0_g2_i1.p1  ORF type:complete len:131 (+),score=38.50 TRINITY_DN2831_c0_g2_i1:92-484(+)
MIRRPPRSTLSSSSAASDVYKRQLLCAPLHLEQRLRVQTFDQFGNRRTCGGEEASAALSEGLGAELSTQDHGDGCYTVRYTPTVPGEGTLCVHLNGQLLGPWSCSFGAEAISLHKTSTQTDTTFVTTDIH